MANPNVVLFGAGAMGRNHARIIAASSRANLVGIVDPFEANGRAATEQFGGEWFAGAAEALKKADAVVVAASTEYHYDIAREILDAGVPVLIEKPICPSLEQTEEILAIAEKRGVPVQCGFLERFNAGVLAAKSMIDEPVYVRAERHSPYWARIKTGVAWDMLVHDADLISNVFGAALPDAVSAELGFFHPESMPGAEDVIDMTLRFPGGGIASASASRIGQRKVRKMTIQSLDSMIEIDLLLRGVTKYRHANIESTGDKVGFKQMTEMEVPEVSGAEPLAAQFDHFVDLVAGRVDMDEERRSILPAHRIIAAALAKK
ncbi:MULTISPECIES: Gfo/Idh/MocA family protein [unclassified Leucobacter]|uniref:Gfo/Idh/MocA family protein n=1 Tax=unclassified Leucobacter TaxID=2621730 RepID=UPI00165E6172|nr:MULTISPECIES: Gfo/Idh/MocA family oxidoreductase [unclassified Leucobacter]MBC9927543.1 Gfo/Idh/MocA family oxidoreductase [Leucobacter sp. cx-169]